MSGAEDPAWPLVQSWSAEATNAHRLLPADDEAGKATLAALGGVTEWSVLGALARHCAALVVDDWLVVLGAGGDGYPGLRDVNTGEDALAGALVVGLDVMGGGFAINGGGLPAGEEGELCYLAPDDPAWMECGLGHSAFVGWALSGPVDDFYADLRWPAWREDVAALAPGQALFAYPPPWATEGKGDDVSRKPVPLLEAWGVLLSTWRQIG
jgi:hypothetical protein